MIGVGGEHRVLIIDDEQVWLETVAVPLEANGLLVQKAKDLEGALESMSSNRFDVAVVDMLLPGDIPEEVQGEYEYAGIWLVERIRKLDPLCNVLVLTGHGTVRLARETAVTKW